MSILANMSSEELQEAMKPLNKVQFTKKGKVKALPTDIVTCKECGRVYTRSASSNHKKTQFHRLKAEMNDKLRDLLFDKLSKK